MRLPRPLIVVALASLLAPAGLAAQGGRGGQPPRNLQVLPKDTPRPQVTALMRSIALALGVRCEHCHVPDPNATPNPGRGGGPELDHALDDKETKKVAREMLRMVMDINQKYLPAMGRTPDPRFEVTCETCHHGLPRPQTLRAALAGAVEAQGADSAVALYRALRTEYFGSAAYDFSELSLNEAAVVVARMDGQRPAAVTLLKLNLEFYPRSVSTLFTLSNVSLLQADTAAAIEALTKASEIDPNNQQIRNALRRLRPGG